MATPENAPANPPAPVPPAPAPSALASPPAPPAPSAPPAPRASGSHLTWLRVLQIALLAAAAIGLVVAWALLGARRMGEWGPVKTVVFSIPFVLGLVLVVLFYRAVRSIDRIRKKWMESNPDDPTCRNLLVVYDLSRKALYIPTITTSLVMSVLMALREDPWKLFPGLDPKVLGGIWLAVFFLNFLVEEYDVDLRSLVLTVVVLAATFMWVAVMGWVTEFFHFFRRFGMELDSTAYLLIAVIFILAILYSILKGSFQYVQITPNYINIQMGLAETGEQLSREQFSTRIDAEDLIERLFGFGRLIITFRDTRRSPMTFLVHGVGSKAAQLEAIRATYLVDEQDPTRGS